MIWIWIDGYPKRMLCKWKKKEKILRCVKEFRQQNPIWILIELNCKQVHSLKSKVRKILQVTVVENLRNPVAVRKVRVSFEWNGLQCGRRAWSDPRTEQKYKHLGKIDELDGIGNNYRWKCGRTTDPVFLSFPVFSSRK